MTIKQLETFRAVYRMHNVNKAAQSIFLSPQAVSKTIQKLEEELGVMLFERTSRGMAPLAAADYLYEECGALLEILTRIPEKLRQFGDADTEIPLGIGYSILPFLGANLLQDYEGMHPGAKIVTVDRTDLELEDLLLNDKLHAILCVGPLDEKKFATYPLKVDKMCIGLLPNHPLYREETVTMEQIQDQAIILCGDRFRTYYEWEAYCKRKGLHCRNVITFTEHWAFMQMMEHMELIWIAPAHTIEVSYPEMRAIEIPDFEWEVVLAKRKGRKLPAVSWEMIHHIVAKFGHED